MLAKVFVRNTPPTYMRTERLGFESERKNIRRLCLNDLAGCVSDWTLAVGLQLDTQLPKFEVEFVPTAVQVVK